MKSKIRNSVFLPDKRFIIHCCLIYSSLIVYTVVSTISKFNGSPDISSSQTQGFIFTVISTIAVTTLLNLAIFAIFLRILRKHSIASYKNLLKCMKQSNGLTHEVTVAAPGLLNYLFPRAARKAWDKDGFVYYVEYYGEEDKPFTAYLIKSSDESFKGLFNQRYFVVPKDTVESKRTYNKAA